MSNFNFSVKFKCLAMEEYNNEKTELRYLVRRQYYK